MPLARIFSAIILTVAVLAAYGCSSSAPAAGTSVPPGGAAPPPALSLAQGAFTAAQAERGRMSFGQNCQICHIPQEFRGRLFEMRWMEGKSVGDLHEFIRATMPFDSPGRLADTEYIEIVAYMLELNGFPAGTSELPDNPLQLQTLPFD
jgi:mono/diheme cytochrome c family protein